MSFARKLELPYPLHWNWQSAWKQNYNGDSFPVVHCVFTIHRTIWFVYIRGGPGRRGEPPSLVPSSRHSPTPAAWKENETQGTRMLHEIYLSVSGFGFSILLLCPFFRVLHVYFRVLSVCFVLRASRKPFSFLHCMILFCILWFWFLCFRFGICVSVLGFGFPFWVLWYVFSLSATIYLTAVCL